MFDIQNYPAFLAAILVFQIVPGAGTLAILDATARHGVRSGMAAVLGTLLGDGMYMLAAMVGLASIMANSPSVFTVMQWLGSGYLCWLGLGMLRQDTRKAASAAADKPGYLGRALAVSLTNPKVMLFFLAFFPLFLHPGASAVTLAAMMAHVTLLSLLYQTLLVLLGNAVARRLAGLPAARQITRRLCGMALIGFGLKLAASR